MKHPIISGLFLLLLWPAAVQAQSSEKPSMIQIKGGTFKMGNIDSYALPGEDPVHKVVLTSFSLSQYEVTVGEYKAFCKATERKMPRTPKWGWNDNHPIVNVPFNDAEDYCKWLSEIHGTPYRLPTEAEWEYAAKGGQRSLGYLYSGSNDANEVSWNYDTSEKQPGSVGKKKPNELGLHDMSGNVWEWCKDFADRYYYHESPYEDPTGPKADTGTNVLRGGSWFHPDTYCRTTHRWGQNPRMRAKYIGFRVASGGS